MQRAVAEKDAVILAYGADTQEERILFERLVARNANNMAFRTWRVRFVRENELESAIREEVQAWETC